MYEKHAPLIHRDGLTSAELVIVQELNNLADSSLGQYLSVVGGSVVNTTAEWTVPFGGTGVTSFTPYAILAGGVTTTGDLQQVNGLGSSGQVLTSNGSGALPTWQEVSGGGIITWKDETPSGTINGSNTTFTLSNVPDANSLSLYRNGQFLTGGGEDYTLSGNTLTLVTAPRSGNILTAKYTT